MQSRSTPPKSLIVGEENSLDSGGKLILSSGKTLKISAKQDLELYGKQKFISYTDGKAEIGAKERMHLFGTNSLITAKDKIEYKAPKMNKLPEEGSFEYIASGEVEQIYWIDENNIKIDTLSQDDEAGIYVKVKNGKQGENVKVFIEEINDNSEKINSYEYLGITDENGEAILKKVFSFKNS